MVPLHVGLAKQSQEVVSLLGVHALQLGRGADDPRFGIVRARLEPFLREVQGVPSKAVPFLATGGFIL